MPSIICALADCIISLLCSLLHTGKLLTLLIIYQGIKSKQSDCSICDQISCRFISYIHELYNYNKFIGGGRIVYREKNVIWGVPVITLNSSWICPLVLTNILYANFIVHWTLNINVILFKICWLLGKVKQHKLEISNCRRMLLWESLTTNFQWGPELSRPSGL